MDAYFLVSPKFSFKVQVRTFREGIDKVLSKLAFCTPIGIRTTSKLFTRFTELKQSTNNTIALKVSKSACSNNVGKLTRFNPQIT